MRVRSPGGHEALPRPAAARAHDERRAFEPEVVVLERVADLLGREGLRRLRAPARPAQQRAAARAVIRGLRVLEAALLAVRRRSCYAGGADFPVRISVRRSTSTWSSTLLPPDRLQPRDELRAQDVDLAVQQAALVADLVLLLLEVVDQVFSSSSESEPRSGSGSTLPPFVVV